MGGHLRCTLRSVFIAFESLRFLFLSFFFLLLLHEVASELCDVRIMGMEWNRTILALYFSTVSQPNMQNIPRIVIMTFYLFQELVLIFFFPAGPQKMNYDLCTDFWCTLLLRKSSDNSSRNCLSLDRNFLSLVNTTIIVLIYFSYFLTLILFESENLFGAIVGNNKLKVLAEIFSSTCFF